MRRSGPATREEGRIVDHCIFESETPNGRSCLLSGLPDASAHCLETPPDVTTHDVLGFWLSPDPFPQPMTAILSHLIARSKPYTSEYGVHQTSDASVDRAWSSV